MIGGHKAAGLIVLGLIAILVLRDAFVRSNLESRPEWAKTAWQGNPQAVIAVGMVRIGEAAAAHRVVDASLTQPVIEAVRRSPLSVEPFLVQGLKRQEVGDEASAGKLFFAAEQRNPREVAPHYFLAAHYAKTGQAALGLTELGKIVRLVPGSSAQLAPRIASAAEQAGGPVMIRSLLSESPELRDDLMRAMSTDARNFDFVLSLRTVTSSTDWQPVMVQSLIKAGLYERAFQLWEQANGVRVPAAGRPLLVDPNFRITAPPPFGWTLASGSSGVAESSSGGLHVETYGRDPFLVASQTVILPRGDYFFAQKVVTATGHILGLSWQISCLDADRKIAEFSLVGITTGALRGKFTVPERCPAQRIDLLSSTVDDPQMVDLMLGPVELRRVL
jgi:hypothetical protein